MTQGKPSHITIQATFKEGTMRTSHRTEGEKTRGRAHQNVHHVVAFSHVGVKSDVNLPNLNR